MCSRVTWRASAVMLCFVLGGCATVTSTPAKRHEMREGLAYFLPKREAKLTVDRKLLKKDEVEKNLAASKAKLPDMEKAAAEAKSNLEKEEKLLVQLDRSSPAGAESEKRRAIFAAQKTLADADLTLLRAKVAQGEADLALLQAQAPAACAFSYAAKLELLPATADERHRFVAAISHSAFRDDDAKLAVTSEGLLTSANAVAADRTTDIIVDMAGAIAGIGVGPEFPGATFMEPGETPADCAQLPTKFIYRFDPVSTASVNEELGKARYPLRLTVNYPGMAEGTSDGNGHGSVTTRTFSQPNEVPFEQLVTKLGRQGALFYPTPVPATVVLRQCRQLANCSEAPGISDPIEAAVVMLPQIGPVSYIPMRSSAFVKTVDDIRFDNGVISSWNANRPSEVLEVVRLPVRVLSALISVPAQIFSLKVNVSDEQKALAASQRSQIEAQTQLEVLKKCLETKQREDADTSSCFD